MATECHNQLTLSFQPKIGVTPVIWTVRGLKLEHRFLVFLVFSHCALKNDFHKCPIGDDLMLGG
jgi:hypothetical protein